MSTCSNISKCISIKFLYIYRGYAKRHLMEGLEAQTLYRYRIRFQNDEGNSEWSQVTSVSTTSKSLDRLLGGGGG